jgi:polyhydroxyalkanoate synthesis regulator phasin
MLDLIHKIVYTGIGLAAMTEQKAQEIVNELVKQGEVSSEEGKTLTKELMEKARHHKEELKKTISEEVKKVCDRFKWVSRDDYEALQKRVEELEGRPAGKSCCDDTL